MNLTRLYPITLVLSLNACAEDKTVTFGAPLAVATYNGGLAQGYVDYTAERTPLVAARIAQEELDLLCVQEFWTNAQFTALTTATASALPYSFRRPAEQGVAGVACNAGELDALEACVAKNCDGVPTDMLTGCALDNCGTEVGALSSVCAGCVAANVGTGTVADVRTACEAEGSGTYAYMGSFGTGILSKYDPTETDSLLFDSTINRRAALYAKIDNTPVGTVHFFCTHLSANLTDVPYRGTHTSWEQEQADQISAFITWAGEKAGADGKVIIAGDLNTGPDIGTVRSDFPANYAMWRAAGYDDPYIDDAANGQPECTFCPTENSLIDDTSESGGFIDHVLVKNFATPRYESSRILTDTTTVTFEGAPVVTNFSDHFGLKLTVREPTE